MIINGNEAKEFSKNYFIDIKANIYHYQNGEYILKVPKIEIVQNKYKKKYIYINGKRYFIHRIYAYFFIKEISSKDRVVVIDENKPISLDNLRILEYKEKDELQLCSVCKTQVKHKYIRCGMCRCCYNDKNNIHQNRKKKLNNEVEMLTFVYENFKLNDKQRLLIELLTKSKSQSEVAKILGISRQAVSDKKLNLLNKYKCYMETQQVKEKLKNNKSLN